MKRHLLDFDIYGINVLLKELGEKPFRAKQVWQWLHCKRVSSFDEMSNLSKALRAGLGDSAPLRVLTEDSHLVSRDGLTEKWLFAAEAGGYIEAVLIRDLQMKRATVCVSSMVGCPFGCVFCATGQGGFERNLSRGEILEQIYRIDHVADGISNIVFMGMGEPLLNYDAVLGTAKIVNSEEGMFLGGRHITISTVGVVEGIERLCDEGVNYRLAVSLHAPNQRIREKLIPTATKWPLNALMPAIRKFSEVASRDITFEYCLIDKVNSTVENARELAGLVSGIPCKINLIPLNPVDGYKGSPPSAKDIRSFQEVLERAGMSAPLRTEKGQDINAACGQLRARK